MKAVVDGTSAPMDMQKAIPKANPVSATWNELTGAYGKYVGSPLWDKGVGHYLPKLLEAVPGGKAVNRAMIYGYRGKMDDATEFNTMLNAMQGKRGAWADYGIDLGNRLQSADEKEQMILGEYIGGELDDLPKHLSDIGIEAKGALTKLGKQATFCKTRN